MNSKDIPKQFLKMNGKPIVVYTLEHFQKSKSVDKIVLVTVETWISYTKLLIEKYELNKVECIVKGGTTGQLSIYNGLVEAEKLAEGENAIVLIHDGVRPMINQEIIAENIESVKKYGSAITSITAIETILKVEDEYNVGEVIDRFTARIARAPQSFYLQDILGAHRMALAENKTNFTDSCTLIKYYKDLPLHLISGPIENIKITTPQDYYVLRAMIEAKENAQLYNLEEDILDLSKELDE